jgi:pimeloyl-ACP methyl ester carboxylesterase
MFQRFQLDRDIVLIDQRGTGDSNALNCEPDDRDEEDFSKIDDYPVGRLRTCLAALKADTRFYTTAIAMDDIDDVRKFLGYGEINLWGGSYGTRAALVYLKWHEDAVRSVVIDGVAPPDMRLPLFMEHPASAAGAGFVDGRNANRDRCDGGRTGARVAGTAAAESGSSRGVGGGKMAGGVGVRRVLGGVFDAVDSECAAARAVARFGNPVSRVGWRLDELAGPGAAAGFVFERGGDVCVDVRAVV